MKKIDVHVHARMWGKAQIEKKGICVTPEEVRESYDSLGVEKGIIMPLVSAECGFLPQSSEEAEYIAKEHPETFLWCAGLDPRMGGNSVSADFSPYLNRCKEHGAVGVGELVSNLYIDDPMVDNLFHHCELCDMPVTIHLAHKKYDTYGLIDDLHLPRLEKMLRKHPNLKIIGHSQCFWSEIGSDVTEETRSGYPTGKVEEGRVAKLMRAYPNLYCDLSAGSGFNALSRDPDFAYKFIDEFADRIMYATDICAPNQELPLSEWLDNAVAEKLISEENYAKICRENAIRVYKL